MRRLTLIALGLCTACPDTLTVPLGASILCSSDADCPAPLTCGSTNVCTDEESALTTVRYSRDDGQRPYFAATHGTTVTVNVTLHALPTTLALEADDPGLITFSPSLVSRQVTFVGTVNDGVTEPLAVQLDGGTEALSLVLDGKRVPLSATMTLDFDPPPDLDVAALGLSFTPWGSTTGGGSGEPVLVVQVPATPDLYFVEARDDGGIGSWDSADLDGGVEAISITLAGATPRSFGQIEARLVDRAGNTSPHFAVPTTAHVTLEPGNGAAQSVTFYPAPLVEDDFPLVGTQLTAPLVGVTWAPQQSPIDVAGACEWTRLGGAGPGAHVAPAMAYDPRFDALVMQFTDGVGASGAWLHADGGWLFQTSQQFNLQGAALVFDSASSTMLLMGGTQLEAKPGSDEAAASVRELADSGLWSTSVAAMPGAWPATTFVPSSDGVLSFSPAALGSDSGFAHMFEVQRTFQAPDGSFAVETLDSGTLPDAGGITVSGQLAIPLGDGGIYVFGGANLSLSCGAEQATGVGGLGGLPSRIEPGGPALGWCTSGIPNMLPQFSYSERTIAFSPWMLGVDGKNATWTPLAAPSVSPGPLVNAGLAPADAHTWLLFGGLNYAYSVVSPGTASFPTRHVLGDVWAFDTATFTWKRRDGVVRAGDLPVARESSGFAQERNGKLFLYGGSDAIGQPQSDSWELECGRGQPAALMRLDLYTLQFPAPARVRRLEPVFAGSTANEGPLELAVYGAMVWHPVAVSPDGFALDVRANDPLWLAVRPATPQRVWGNEVHFTPPASISFDVELP